MAAFTTSPARYAKGMMAVRVTPDGSGFKTRAARLCDYLKARWSNRERAYILSPAKARKLAELHDAGYDADYDAAFTGRLIRPGELFPDD